MNYYYYISGLPDIRFEDTTLQLDMTALRNGLREELTVKDFESVQLIFLRYDNINLMKLLRKQDAGIKQEGNYTKEELLSYIRDVKELGEVRADCPEYISRFLRAFSEGVPVISDLGWEEQLASLYYEYVQQSGNIFLQDWLSFELNINNIQVGSSCHKYGLEQRKSVVGDNEIAESIRTSNSKDFGLHGMSDELEEVLRIAIDDANIYEREKAIDMIKWKYLEENSFFHYFSIERIIVFLLQTEIISRWSSLNKERGNIIFNDTIGQLIKSTSGDSRKAEA